MSASRDRKEAAKNLGISLQVRYRKLIEANGTDEITVASVDLGTCFNENIEFIIWSLKEFGGMTQLPFERMGSMLGRTKPGVEPDLPVLDNTLLADPIKIPCQCPPLEPGIIGNRHMTSCSEYKP